MTEPSRTPDADLDQDAAAEGVQDDDAAAIALAEPDDPDADSGPVADDTDGESR